MKLNGHNMWTYHLLEDIKILRKLQFAEKKLTIDQHYTSIMLKVLNCFDYNCRINLTSAYL